MTTSRTRKAAAPSSAAKKSSGAAGTPATKKSSSKKASAARTSAKKSSASTAKKTAQRSQANDESDGTTPTRKRVSAPRAEAKPKPKAAQIARDAANQLRELTGKDVEGITGFTATDDGWS